MKFFSKIIDPKYWPQWTILSLLVVGFGAYNYFAYYDTRSTDAYVSANVVDIASLVSGSISMVYVKDNQPIKKGDKLIEIDPAPFQYAANAAKAALDIAKLNNDKLAAVAAEAKWQTASYFLQNTTLRAPADGYVTNVNCRVGQYVKAGQGLFALVESGHWWVITRFRETALRLVKPNDKVTITLDMYPGMVFHGHVEGISWGINRVQMGDSAPSTLPYVKATEDWIKIAQRFPVRILIDDPKEDYPLRVGASASILINGH